MPFNFSWIRDGALAGMGYPTPDAWPRLVEEGVGAVVTLTWDEPPGDPRAAGLEVLHAPIPDFGTPSDEELLRTLEFIRRQIDAGRGVVVHCRAGQGRTGTVLAAYLVYEGSAADDAIAEVRAARPGSIETGEQVELVRRLARTRRRRAEEGA